MTQNLLNSIQNNTAKIGIIGMGYVGLPLSLAFCQVGFVVTGFDIDQAKCDAINAGETYIKHIPAERYEGFVNDKLLNATSDFSGLGDMDVIIICVPTPLNVYREPDLSYIEKTGHSIAAHGRKGQLVVLESSTYPGTTRDVLGGILKDKAMHLAYSPEREDPSNPDFTTQTIPKVVGADTDEARALSQALYEQIINQVVVVSGADVAEAVKLTENIFRSVNIALVNELKTIYDRMGIDVWEVIEAASTKPFGYMPFYPGPGLGGHCIPIDPFYLSWKAREYGVTTRFIELAGEINTAMPDYVVARLTDALNERFAKGLNEAKILIVGVAYKGNLDDDRESPAYKIMTSLEHKKAQVDYHDPHIPVLAATRKYPGFAGRKSVEITAEVIGSYDAVLICTKHDSVDHALIAEHANLVIDTRNAMAEFDKDNVVKA